MGRRPGRSPAHSRAENKARSAVLLTVPILGRLTLAHLAPILAGAHLDAAAPGALALGDDDLEHAVLELRLDVLRVHVARQHERPREGAVATLRQVELALLALGALLALFAADGEHVV